MATLHTRRRLQIGPTDYTGITFAAFLGLIVFTIIVGFETQHIARLDGYRHDLGAPLFGHLYEPFASLQWMYQVDGHFDLQRAVRGQSYFVSAPNEQAWVRAAFASERARLPFEAIAALLVFAISAIFWLRRVQTTGLYGNQRWATTADKRRSSLTQGHSGIVCGQDPKTHELFVHNGEETVLVLGPPGAGKTDGTARPTLVGTWGASAIVFDPSGDLRDRTIAERRALGDVYVFDPRDPKTHAYNPIAGVAATNTGLIYKILSSAMLERDLSEMDDGSRFFMSQAIEFGTAVVGRSIEVRGDTFTAAANLYYAGDWTNDDEFCQGLMTSEIPFIAETGSKYFRMDKELRSSIIGTLTQFLALFRSDDVARATRQRDFDIEMLRAKSSTLYLVVREGDQAALNPLLRMVLTRLLDDATDRLPTREELTIIAMIDEFPLLKAPVIKSKLATLRKYRIRPVLLAQSLTQIKEYYGENEPISGICDVRIIFPTLDEATQDLATRSCGDETAWDVSRGMGQQQSNQFSEVGRPLLPPEVLGSPAFRKHVVIIKKGEYPILAVPVRSHSDPRFNQPVPTVAPPAPAPVATPESELETVATSLAT